MNLEKVRLELQGLPREVESPRMGKAIERIRRDADLLRDFEAQQSLDRVVDAAIFDVRVDQSAVAAMEASLAPPKRPAFLNPAILSAIAAVVVLGAVVASLLVSESGGFEGMNEVERMTKTSQNLTVDDFEPIEVGLGQLGDWFVMKGFEGFQVPEPMAKLSTVGARVFKFEGTSVACAAIPEGQMFLFVFDGSALGVDPGDGWKILETPPLVSAVTKVGRMCVVVTIHGSRDQMQELIRNPAEFAQQAARQTQPGI